MLTQTASIGNAVLISALRLQNNHYIYVDQKHLNTFDTGCFKCPHYQKNSSACASCDHKVYEYSQQKKYINEKNRYSVRKVLKRNALLLFMYLHFLNPDAAGLIQFDIEDAADLLNCTERSIRNNLRLLEKANYIIVKPSSIYGVYSAFITEYPSYFKKASMGGRGYSVISKDVFYQLLKMKDINSLRLSIRSLLIDIDNTKKPELRKSYKDLHYILPDYCTKKDIKNIITSTSFSSLFSASVKKRYVVLNIKDEFNVTKLANILRQQCKEAVQQQLHEIEVYKDKNHLKESLVLSNTDMIDICNIALKFPIRNICNSLMILYTDYIVPHLPIGKIGSLLRTITESNTYLSSLA